MVDSRFFQNKGPFSLAEIAALTGATLSEESDPALKLNDVAPLDKAGAHDISFFDNNRYLDSFTQSKAGAVFVRKKHAAQAPQGMALLISEDPYYCYALAARRFYPPVATVAGIAPTAIIDASATVGKEVSVEHHAVISAQATIGDRCAIGANSYIGPGVVIGDDTVIKPNCTIQCAIIGKRVLIHPGVNIGQDGFGFALGKEGHIKVPQLGRVLVDDDVEIGAGTCIDRGTGPDTHINAGAKIDNLVQIGHNVQIGRHAVVVAQVGIAGSSRVGDGAVLGGQVGVAGHLKIGPGAKLAAQSGIMHDIPAGQAYGGSPAVSIKDWHRQTIAINRLIRKKPEEDNS